MRKLPLWILLPLMLLGACQSSPTSAPAGRDQGRPCPPREQDSGQCGRAGSLSSFPELSNI